eukprot:TRINITY_DN2358_c0_g1_i1.p1 TRINITY_DN2358_c0_g1~~TRINITY_DN2358_c0_g1_i1.p1  ORF type:complete len:177 (-),score=60.34 TRINITY_DN2358_c0_g1_i1:42-572(-)
MEMKNPPPQFEKFVDSKDEFIVKVPNIPLHYFRYLFQTIGEPWLWVSRLEASDEELSSVIHHPDVEIFVMYKDGCPAGFIELSRKVPKEVELVYCGVMPHYIGKGLGRRLLNFALDQVWNHSKETPDRFWLITGDNDHPKAMDFYRSFGFKEYGNTFQLLRNDPWDSGLFKSPKRN